MTRKEELKDLLGIIKFDLDTAHHYASVFPDERSWRISAKASLGSMDAALALLEDVLPGWGVCVWTGGKGDYAATVSFAEIGKPMLQSGAKSDTPARALLIAILKALVEVEDCG